MIVRLMSVESIAMNMQKKMTECLLFTTKKIKACQRQGTLE